MKGILLVGVSVTTLLMSACAAQLPNLLEYEAGEIWKCEGSAFYDGFFAVADVASDSGYIVVKPSRFISKLQKTRSKRQVLPAESLTTGIDERSWQFKDGSLRIWNDGSGPGFAGTVVLFLKDSAGASTTSFPIDMRCTKEDKTQ